MFFYHINTDAKLNGKPIASGGMLFWLDVQANVDELSKAFFISDKPKTSDFIKNRGNDYVYLISRSAAQELREDGKLNIRPAQSSPSNINQSKGLIVYDEKQKSMLVYDQFPASIFKTMKDNTEILGKIEPAKPEPKASTTRTTSSSTGAAKKSKAADILRGIWKDFTSCMPHKYSIK